MTLRQKLLTALAGTTSQTAITTEDLSVGHIKSRVKAELLMMYANRQACTCTIRKPGKLVQDVWWLIGNANVSMVYKGTVKANKRAKARAEVDCDDD